MESTRARSNVIPMLRWKQHAALLIVSISGTPLLPSCAAASEAPMVDLSEIIQFPERWSGKEVIVEACVQTVFRASWMYDPQDRTKTIGWSSTNEVAEGDLAVRTLSEAVNRSNSQGTRLATCGSFRGVVEDMDDGFRKPVLHILSGEGASIQEAEE